MRDVKHYRGNNDNIVVVIMLFVFMFEEKKINNLCEEILCETKKSEVA